MMRFTHSVPAALVLAAALGLTGCGSDSSDGDPAATDASTESPSTQQSSSPSKEKATVSTPKSSYPEVGLEFTRLPEPKNQQQAAALQTLVDYEVAVMHTLTEVKMDPALPDLAAPPVVQRYQSSLDYQREHNDLAYRGTRGLAVDTRTQSDRMAAFDICADLSDSYLVDADGKREEVNTDQALVRVTLVPVGPSWRVATEEESKDPC